MGYGHSWEFKPTDDVEAANAALKKSFNEFDEINTLYESLAPDCEHLGSFYDKDMNIEVNGLGDLEHEPFIIRKEFEAGYGGCKTIGKPYDVLVVAFLCVLKDNLGDLIEINPPLINRNDSRDAFQAGQRLAQTALGRKIRNPIPREIGPWELSWRVEEQTEKGMNEQDAIAFVTKQFEKEEPNE